MSLATIDVSQHILGKNEALAKELRDLYAKHGICVVNLLSGPGAGKTSTILATIEALKDSYHIAVIEGDIASDVDAQKVKEHGAQAVQINTGGICHLEGAMIKRATERLDLNQTDLIIIENVGNLVCTVDFDLGESFKAMILSVPEGHDKPLKYPGIFQACNVILLNKIDTLPVFDFDTDAFYREIDDLNPNAQIFPISATKHDGMDAWIMYLTQRIEEARSVALSE